MKVLVLNCGSSSLKFQVIEPTIRSSTGQRDQRWARGVIERIGETATCTFEAANDRAHRESVHIGDHESAVQKVLAWLDSRPGMASKTLLEEVDAIGHRIVHGGDRFRATTILDDEAVATLEALNDLAPLHNPPAVKAMRACRRILGPSIPMVAAFDTAFHQTLPDYAARYALPYELAQRHAIRRYGFHGLAHEYVATRYAELTATPPDRTKIITLHLGNGCSASAISGGKSIDTSMGFTPLEGLVMGTRSGDLDPAVVSYLVQNEGVSVAEVEAWLNERSGLLGISGRSNDMRELLAHAAEDARARLAIDLFCYRARKYVGAYLAVLGGADAVVFSGGIGEHSPPIRARICDGMQWCALAVDPQRNAAIIGVEGRISPADAGIHVYVIPSDEELLIARDTIALLQQ